MQMLSLENVSVDFFLTKLWMNLNIYMRQTSNNQKRKIFFAPSARNCYGSLLYKLSMPICVIECIALMLTLYVWLCVYAVCVIVVNAIVNLYGCGLLAYLLCE